MSATTAMEVNAEARRILAVSISKLYASRTQRGGLRLHRSLLLSMVMRSARDIYHSSRECEESSSPEEPMRTDPAEQPRAAPSSPEPPAAASEEPDSGDEESDGELAEDKENMSPATRQSRKRRGKAAAAPDFLPSKRARLEPGEERHAVRPGEERHAVRPGEERHAARPGEERHAARPGEERHAARPAGCRAAAGDSLSALSMNRAIPAF